MEEGCGASVDGSGASVDGSADGAVLAVVVRLVVVREVVVVRVVVVEVLVVVRVRLDQLVEAVLLVLSLISPFSSY